MRRTYTTSSVLAARKAVKVLRIMKSDYTVVQNDNGSYTFTFTCNERTKRYIDEAFRSSYIR